MHKFCQLAILSNDFICMKYFVLSYSICMLSILSNVLLLPPIAFENILNLIKFSRGKTIIYDLCAYGCSFVQVVKKNMYISYTHRKKIYEYISFGIKLIIQIIIPDDRTSLGNYSFCVAYIFYQSIFAYDNAKVVMLYRSMAEYVYWTYPMLAVTRTKLYYVANNSRHRSKLARFGLHSIKMVSIAIKVENFEIKVPNVMI